MMEWLLGIDRLAPGDPDVVFALARPMPAWACAMIVLAAGALGWISYTRLEGSRVAKTFCACERHLRGASAILRRRRTRALEA